MVLKQKAAIVMIAVFFLELSPAFRYNLFIFKEKIKRIFTSIGAKIPRANSLNL
jgi:hypothetical protein